MLRPIRLYNCKLVSKVIFGGRSQVVDNLSGSFFQALDQRFTTRCFPPEDQPCLQLLGLQPLAVHVHLMDLYKDKYFSDFANNGQRLPGTI